MVVDAMIYMYLVGLGCSAGIATTFFIALKLYRRMENKQKKKSKFKRIGA